MVEGWLDVGQGDPWWLLIAYFAGMLARTVGLPPLVGYLGTGFLLNALGAEYGQLLDQIADLGVTLLLFTIGLKIDLRSLLRFEVIGAGALHMLGIVAGFGAIFLGLAALNVGAFVGLSQTDAILIAFAFSFSSTVFAIKVLEEQGAITSRNGRVAIGILVLQDIIAVVYLSAAQGKAPSIWAILLLLLIPIRPGLRWLMRRSGHGELLLLFGITMALIGAGLFVLVGIKGDLGALVLGMLLAGGGKADELNKTMMGVKDLFLVGFFLEIGLDVLPTVNGLVAAAILMLLLPLKTLWYLRLLTWSKLRARTAWQASLDLTSYSEFGLIVTAVAVEAGDLGDDWLAVVAVAVAVSFAVSAPIAERGDHLFAKYCGGLRRWERKARLPGDEDLHLYAVQVVVFGMGRMGTRAYEAVAADFGGRVLGVDVDEDIVMAHSAEGHRVVLGDATDPDFWSRSVGLVDGLQWVLLTASSQEANVAAVKRLRDRGYSGRIAATSLYPDDADQLRDIGVDFAFDVYAEAGSGFAGDLRSKIQDEAGENTEDKPDS
ncbi:MAG: cation:proton antiporter [Actinomycetia bacterium]|nr:cation:proton antiporter [Actinomycetes bacterium]MCH9801817.1 cation:proton antiporter [Actinomycetes bacterium]